MYMHSTCNSHLQQLHQSIDLSNSTLSSIHVPRTSVLEEEFPSCCSSSAVSGGSGLMITGSSPPSDDSSNESPPRDALSSSFIKMTGGLERDGSGEAESEDGQEH